MPRKKPKSLNTKAIPQVLTPEVLDREDQELDAQDEVEAEEIEADGDVAQEIDGDPHHTDASLLPAQPDNLEPELRAVSATDPLRRYLEEVRRYSLLTPEEEIKLVTQLKNEGSVQSSMEAAKRLVQANLRLVVKIAFEYRSVYANVMDLIQEGNIGLMKAVSKYDPTKGARLGYYSSWWIRSYILKYLLDNFRLVKIGTTQAQKKLFFHLMREKQKLEAQGLLAAPKLLAEKLEVREKDVIEMDQRLSGAGGEVSLDSPVRPGDQNATTFVELLRDDHEGADDRLARDELLQMLSKRIPEFEKNLNDKERKLLRDRILAEEPKTLQEVADNYGLTRERARQIEAKVIQKLREFLAPDLR